MFPGLDFTQHIGQIGAAKGGHIMSNKKYKVAVVGGAGTWGHQYVKEYVERSDCEVIAIVDRAKDRREGFADLYNIEKTFDSVAELLAYDVPDIVSAIVPVGQNHDIVIACAEAGVKAISCEKPISAQLAEADRMVNVCREHGAVFACGQGASAASHTPEIIEWVREGKIGQITDVAIPCGIPREVSGGGCIQLSAMRMLTGMDTEWVEGWSLPPLANFEQPDRAEVEVDSPAYGRLGLSGGIVCNIPKPDESNSTWVTLIGEKGSIWLTHHRPVLIKGSGAMSSPVFPEFLEEPWGGLFVERIEQIIRATETGSEVLSSGDDFRHALEIAIAIKLSANNGHERVTLPLEDRSLRLYPHPYRLLGGDVAGWQSIGYAGPPEVI